MASALKGMAGLKFAIGALLLLLVRSAIEAQTSCGNAHTGAGVFICYPNPAESPEDETIDSTFHLSAQVNAPAGRRISRYEVIIDDRRVYQTRLSTPVTQVSIETNVRSPFASGVHTLRLEIDGSLSSQVEKVNLRPSTSGFCDLFSRVDSRTCLATSDRQPLQWSPTDSANTGANRVPTYFDFVDLYARNLKSLEADIADAFAVDKQNDLYTASHSSADIELRKYAPNGSLVYDDLFRARSVGFLSLNSMAIDEHGHVWIAGNTTAELVTTPNALQAQITEPGRSHGFVMLVDTSRRNAPVYVTYLAQVENHISALRVDAAGNVYIAGTTTSAEFPHNSMLPVGAPQDVLMGFVAVLNVSGSALRWSTLIRGTQITALTTDGLGAVYVTGRASRSRGALNTQDLIVAGLTKNGSRISYLGRLADTNALEGRAISLDDRGKWLLLVADRDFSAPPTDTKVNPLTHQENGLAMALRPCRGAGATWMSLPFPATISKPSTDAVGVIPRQPSLDAFTKSFPGMSLDSKTVVPKKQLSVEVAPDCLTGGR